MSPLPSLVRRTALAVVVVAFAGCATTRAIDTSGAREATLAELRADPEALTGPLARGEGTLLLKIAAGESVPVAIGAHAPFAELEGGGGTLRFPRDVFLLIGRDGFWLSPDGERWAAIHDGEALKEVFGATQGALEIGFEATPEEGPAVHVQLKLE